MGNQDWLCFFSPGRPWKHKPCWRITPSTQQCEVLPAFASVSRSDLHDTDNHDGAITHLELDILECEVKWALGSITINKAHGGDGIPLELFQVLKDDAVKVLHSICQHIWKTQQWPQDWKRSVFIPIPKKGNDKECQWQRMLRLLYNCTHLTR